MKISYLIPTFKSQKFIKAWDFKSKVDVGFIGVPSDKAIDVVGGRPGARFGPNAVREILKEYFPEHYDKLKNLKIADLGNIDVINETIDDIPKTHERIEKVLTKAFEIKIIPVVLGGDHSITYPIVKALHNSIKEKNIGIIYFDAHYDMRPLKDGKISSGTSFRRILELPRSPVRGKNLVVIGIQKPLTLKDMKRSRYNELTKYAKQNKVRIFTMDKIKENGIKDVVKDALKFASENTEAIYLSVDADCLDKRYALGASAPGLNRLSVKEVSYGVRRIANHPLLRGMDIVEISPPLDRNNTTSKAGAEIIFSFLEGINKRMKVYHEEEN